MGVVKKSKYSMILKESGCTLNLIKYTKIPVNYLEGYMAKVAYYKDGIPYEASGQVIITITNAKTYSDGAGGYEENYGMGLVTKPNSVSVTIDPLALADNVPAIHRQEMLAQMEETDQQQKHLDQALLTAQQNTARLGSAYLSLLNAGPAARAQALVAYQNAVVAELQAKIASEQCSLKYIELDIIMQQGRLWWPSSDDDAAQAQEYIDARAIDKANVEQLIQADQQGLAEMQAAMKSVETVTAEIETAVKFTADFLEKVTDKFGEKAGQSAQKLADSAQGKKLRNADEALAAFNKYQATIYAKFGVQDRQAMANALAALDANALARNLAQYSKALSRVSYGIDGWILVRELQNSLKSGDYKPFFLKVESMGAAYLATELVAWVFAVMTGTAIGILGYALLMTVVGALISDQLLDNIITTLFG